jgi:hypothetical protein
MGVDFTRKWPSEGFTRPWPDEIKMDRETKKKVDALWPKLGLWGRMVMRPRGAVPEPPLRANPCLVPHA